MTSMSDGGRGEGFQVGLVVRDIKWELRCKMLSGGLL